MRYITDREPPFDMIDSHDLDDIKEPALRNEPTLRKDSAEPIEATDRTEPIEPMLSTELRDPMHRIEFEEAMLQRDAPAVDPMREAHDVTAPG